MNIATNVTDIATLEDKTANQSGFNGLTFFNGDVTASGKGSFSSLLISGDAIIAGELIADKLTVKSENGSHISSFYVDNDGVTHIGENSVQLRELDESEFNNGVMYDHSISTSTLGGIKFDVEIEVGGHNVGATLTDHENRISSLEARVAQLEAEKKVIIEQITKVYKQENGDRILVNYSAFTGEMIDVPRKLNFFEFSTPIYSADAVVWHWDADLNKSVLLKRSDIK